MDRSYQILDIIQIELLQVSASPFFNVQPKIGYFESDKREKRKMRMFEKAAEIGKKNEMKFKKKFV